MSVPAQPYGSFAPSPNPLRGGVGIVTFALGLLVGFGLVVYAAWLVVAAVAAVGNAAQHVGGSLVGATEPSATEPMATEPRTVQPPVPALPGPPTPNGSTLAFDQLWISGDGNTIVAGLPTVGISALTGESLIQIPVTLTNNGERNWSPESTAFVATLNHAPVAESTEGDWMYRSPIVPHTSVTLTKIFVGYPGDFALTVRTAHSVASFAGRV